MTAHSRLMPTLVIGALFVAALAMATSHGDPASLPDDLDDYAHINTLVVPDRESPIHGIHHFYMSETGRQTFQSGGAEEYPEETVIVGKVFAPVKTDEGRYKEGDLVAYTMMRKDADAPETDDTGGWRFTMHGPDGATRGVNPVKDCFGCHRPSPETDFVLSTPLR